MRLKCEHCGYTTPPRNCMPHLGDVVRRDGGQMKYDGETGQRTMTCPKCGKKCTTGEKLSIL